MHTMTSNKLVIIQKFEKMIAIEDTAASEWKIGMGSLQRASLLNVKEEIVHQKSPMDEAAEIMFHFIVQGVKTCNMSKTNVDGIYLYR